MQRLLSLSILSLLVFSASTILVPSVLASPEEKHEHHNEYRNDHYRHWKKYNEYLEQNKEKVIPYLSNYLNKEQPELEKLLQNGAELHTLVKASILSKLGKVDVTEILTKKENGQSFKDIAKELNVDKEDIYTEMKKMKETIKKS
ncbi:MAG: hypothetical protein U9Q88_20460 [Bacillota bacterium]|uniref:hypothetical protein n=1 Tax=Bacillus sp. RO2 TaxID=2723913 RepID=UPI00145F795B|nr:hypothetical protein [Bacillus sp. RO2]MEA3322376.1 hypothetical protein [Bacillota bacterium]NMH73293.1 hypothetical protein [Bacillus sp. RO2]